MDIILKHTLNNAFIYGKADFKSVAGKVFGEDPNAKKNAKETMRKIKESIEKVNKMKKSEILSQLKKIAPELLVKKKIVEKKELPELDNVVKDNFKVRFPPEPSGYPHIGHAISSLMNYLYAKKYGGKFVLKFEDTNPLKAKPEFYEAIKEGLTWLGIKWDSVFVLSEHLSELEEAATKLIQEKKVYACSCSAEGISKRRRELIADPCRQNSIEQNLKLWDEMKHGKKYVLRWLGDPKHKNAVMRDPTIYRVVDAVHPHTGKNHVVYPNYDFASAFTDGLIGITHILRSEEFLQRTSLHKEIISACGFTVPTYKHYGRFEMEGTPVSKRLIRPLVEDGSVEGWDDPRLATLKGLRRKGIVPETFKDLTINSGPYRGKSVLSWKLIHGFNKKHIDPIAGRFFVILNPVELKLVPDGESEEKEFTAKIPLMPNTKEIRKLLLKDKVIIDESDFKVGTKIRLKGAYNVEIGENDAKNAGDEMMRPIVQWLSQNYIEGELWISEKLFEGDKLLPIEKKKVLVEKNLVNWEGEFVQMERVGFAKIDSRNPLRLIKIC